MKVLQIMLFNIAHFSPSKKKKEFDPGKQINILIVKTNEKLLKKKIITIITRKVLSCHNKN